MTSINTEQIQNRDDQVGDQRLIDPYLNLFGRMTSVAHKTWAWMRMLNPRYYVAWTLTLLSVAGCFFIYQRVEQSLDRNQLFPSPVQRYEIPSMRVSLAEQVCPEIKTMGAERRAFEACMQRHDNGRRWPMDSRLIKVPGVDDILTQPPPRFLDLMTQQGQGDIAEAIGQKANYLFVIPVPAKYFTPGDVRDIRSILSFSMMIAGVACIEGRCGQVISRFSPHPNGVDLVASSVAADGDQTISVWIFGRDDPFRLGISLKHGLFVSTNQDLMPLYREDSASEFVKPTIFSFIFAGLILGVLLYCLAWGYVDFAVLAYLAFSISLFIISSRWSLFPELSNLEIVRLYLGAGFNVVAATIAFALATARIRGWMIFAWIIGALALAVFFSLRTISPEVNELIGASPSYIMSGATVLILVPPAICVLAALRCAHLARRAQRLGDKRSIILRLWRRVFFQQAPYAVILFTFGIEVLRYGKARLAGIESEAFLPTSTMLFFGLFALMAFNTVLQQLLDRINSSDASEADEMISSVGTDGFMKWAALVRDGVILNPDVAGMTAAAERLGQSSHDVMSKMGEALFQVTKSIGFHWIYDGEMRFSNSSFAFDE